MPGGGEISRGGWNQYIQEWHWGASRGIAKQRRGGDVLLTGERGKCSAAVWTTCRAAGWPVGRKGIIPSQIALHLSDTQQRRAFSAQVEDIQDTLEKGGESGSQRPGGGGLLEQHLCFCDAGILRHEAQWSASELTPGGSVA